MIFPLTLMGFTLLLDQHFPCTTFFVRGLVCLSAGNGKCRAMKSRSRLTTLSRGPERIKHRVLLATCTNLSIFFFCHWKHQPPFSLCSLAFNLYLFSTPLIHSPTSSIQPPIFFFHNGSHFRTLPLHFLVFMALIFLTPAQFFFLPMYLCYTHINRYTLPVSPSTLLACTPCSLFTT